MGFVLVLLAVLVVLATAQFTLGPILVYQTQKSAPAPRFTQFRLDDPPMWLPASYRPCVEQMAEIGFEPVAHLYNAGNVTGTRTSLTFFLNHDEMDQAVVAHIIAEPHVATFYFEFATEFWDGGEMCTNNSPHPSIFAKLPDKVIYRVPHLQDPRRLDGVHKALVSRRPRVGKKMPPQGQEEDSLCQSMARDLRRQAETGYLYLDDSGEWFRPTVKGAILMTWRLAWPVDPLRSRLQRLQGIRLVRALGMGTAQRSTPTSPKFHPRSMPRSSGSNSTRTPNAFTKCYRAD
jgi:hypothetical protein